MKKLYILSLIAILMSSLIVAQTNHSGTISSNETWLLADGPHTITGNITVADGITLTIEEGNTVYVDAGRRIRVRGALIANGSAANNITFTSNSAIPAKGDWNNIYFTDADAGSILNYCNVEYGGSTAGLVRVVNSASNVTITNCNLSNSATYGIYVSNAAANPIIADCNISDCDSYPIYTQANNVNNITGMMTFSGNAPDAIWVNGGSIYTGQWLNHNVPYILGTKDFTVLDGQTLDISAGVVMKIDGNRQFRVLGAMNAVGTLANPIVFTSNAAVPAPGDWENIYYNAVDWFCQMDHCKIEYAGSQNGAIYTNNNFGWFITIQFTEISNSLTYGFYNRPNSNAKITGCTIHDCGDYPIRTGANSVGRVGAIVSSMYGNNPDAIRVDGQAITNNWTWYNHSVPYIIWGDVTINDTYTVTLNPGLEFKFQPGTRFQTNGRLIANGTETEHIVFTSNETVPAAGDWERLYFYSADAGTLLNYCDIMYGGSNLGAIDLRATGSNVDIYNSTIMYSATSGINVRNGSNPILINNTITENTSEGIKITGANTPVFGSNESEWNEIHNNGSYELLNGTNNINAKYIYWGSEDCNDLGDFIYDKEDQANLGIVDYVPWLNMGHGLPSFATTWTGAVNTSWNEDGNWDENVPCFMIDVTIPDLPNQPVVFSDESCNDLTMEAGSQLTIFSGSQLDVNGDFLMEANAAGTSSLVENGNFSVSGNTAVEFYVTEDRWHYVSPPMSNQVSNVFNGIYLYDYDEATDIWNNIVDTTVLLNTGQGYKIWSSSTIYPFTGTTSVTYEGGVLNSGNISPALTNIGNGWNFVGNPYPSAVDWDNIGWIKSDISGTVYVWDGVQYITWNGSTGDLTDGIIPAQQGFFVEATGSNPGLIVSNTTRTHGVDPYKNEVIIPSIEFMVTGNGYSDKTFVEINEEATTAFDQQFDGYKLYGIEEAPQLYTFMDNQILRVNSIPKVSSDLTLQMGLEVGAKNEYTIYASGINTLGSNVEVYLEDLQENVIINLNKETAYSFIASPSDDANRFLIHFSVLGFEKDFPVLEQQKEISIYSNEHTIYINNFSGLELDGDVVVYNIMGQEIYRERLQNVQINKINLITDPGYFIVKVQTGTSLYSEKVFIK
ncbi:MAG: T9SS type A sorting domain-containing protein [Bacteroidales bacterium]